ncbi:carbohydrate ABC transporter permease [Liquorilactobacillus vini]|uniref:ABC transmembrane type-1 domain-containing protein n=1 Tax=Liquorilactobacillus vini DSM 20605 TaxID=1133569 RepID=A0A0R2BTT4_9LACO|nr:sugar ABC transporter permease [Liquorilactobacillus vini]KRM82512.1 hypothetical protein FD21_GL000377 [Liquorilactobacillus vini DSM 20605]
MKRYNNKLGWAFISPYIIFTIIFFLIPLVWSFWLALTNWNLISPSIKFIGLNNFWVAIRSSGVHEAFWVSYEFLILFVPISLCFSMIIAILVNKLPKFRGLFLVAFFLPYLSSGVVTSLIVKGLLSSNGPINTFLGHFGIDLDIQNQPFTALLVISIMIAWKMSGYYGLILFSGLGNIDKEIYEAVSLDGITKWKQFWKITVPLLYPSLYTVLILAIGTCFGVFTEVYQLTGGGPNGATNTWQMQIYKDAFENLKSGYASAEALIAAVITFLSITVLQKMIEKWGKHYSWN